jgi:hypothetical protein
MPREFCINLGNAAPLLCFQNERARFWLDLLEPSNLGEPEDSTSQVPRFVRNLCLPLTDHLVVLSAVFNIFQLGAVVMSN